MQETKDTADEKYTTLDWPWDSRYKPLITDFIRLASKLKEVGLDLPP